jgi:hypothetical protein
MPDDPKDHVLWHQSGISPHGEPFVQLLRDDKIIAQMSPEQARDHARAVTEAAEAAEQDAFIWDWVLNKVGAGKDQAYGLIVDFRKYRAERTGKSQGPTRPTDWVMPPPDKMPDYGDDGDFTKKNPK